jgi:CheY-like chemotaxis protein
MNQPLTRARTLAEAFCTPTRDLHDSPLASSAIEDERARRETVLLVEDEPFVRDVTCAVLRAAGYRVWPAQNSADAKRLFDAQGDAVDLLITDIVLPGETGFVLARKLRNTRPLLKILFVTGYAQHMSLPEGENDRCLAKPFSQTALLRNMREMLDHVAVEANDEVDAEKNALTHACAIA